MRIATPLRYPGGKSVMSGFFEDYIKINQMHSATYAEPYAGGAGAAINLLLNGSVSNIIINDASIAIFSFWNSLINDGDAFLELFDTTIVSLDEWYHQKQIFESSTVPSLELGFATFFLNRCNRSGILKGGPIGGGSYEKQKLATYKIDARYNKTILREKLENIIVHKSQISVFNDDAKIFMQRLSTKSPQEQFNTLVYLDPPYYIHGSKLYLNFYKHEDHAELAEYLKRLPFIKWILSYDNVEAIRRLYSNYNQYTFDLNYSVQSKRNGKELLIHSNNSILPYPLEIKRVTKVIPIVAI